MMAEPKYGDLVVYDDGFDFIIGVWKDGSIFYKTYFDGTWWHSIKSSLGKGNSLVKYTDILQTQFDRPRTFCKNCGAITFDSLS